MDMREKSVSTEYIFKGRVINLRRDTVLLPNGKEATREVAEHSGGVCVVALTNDNQVLLVRQYRRPFDTILTEIPAGKLNPGEDHFSCGVRELEEETGYKAKNFKYLGAFYPTPGFCNEIIHIYLATGLYKGQINPDEDEFLENYSLPLDTLCQMVKKGEIKDGKTALGVMLAASDLGKK